MITMVIYHQFFAQFLSDRGTSGIDIDLQRVDINQCPAQSARAGSTQDNIFADSHKCKNRTTKVKPFILRFLNNRHIYKQSDEVR